MCAQEGDVVIIIHPREKHGAVKKDIKQLRRWNSMEQRRKINHHPKNMKKAEGY